MIGGIVNQRASATGTSRSRTCTTRTALRTDVMPHTLCVLGRLPGGRCWRGQFWWCIQHPYVIRWNTRVIVEGVVVDKLRATYGAGTLTGATATFTIVGADVVKHCARGSHVNRVDLDACFGRHLGGAFRRARFIGALCEQQERAQEEKIQR